jgi:hypothetical protein
MARDSLAFIGRFLPALGNHFGAHARSSFAALVPTSTKTDHLLVGRLHYSLRTTLSAHFRWGFCASECLTVAS